MRYYLLEAPCFQCARQANQIRLSADFCKARCSAEASTRSRALHKSFCHIYFGTLWLPFFIGNLIALSCCLNVLVSGWNPVISWFPLISLQNSNNMPSHKEHTFSNPNPSTLHPICQGFSLRPQASSAAWSKTSFLNQSNSDPKIKYVLTLCHIQTITLLAQIGTQNIYGQLHFHTWSTLKYPAHLPSTIISADDRKVSDPTTFLWDPPLS